MASETEIERLIIRLVGDASDYKDVLNDALKDSLNFLQKLEKEFDETKAQNQMLAEAAKIVESVQTPYESYVRSVANLNEHLAAGTISQETYNRAIEQLNGSLPEAQAAQAQLNQLQADAEAITRSARTEYEIYAETTERLREHLEAGRITQETYTRAMEEARQKLPEVREEMKQLEEEQSRANASLEAVAGNFRELGMTVAGIGAVFSGSLAGSAAIALAAWGEEERALLQLEAVLQSQGKEVDRLVDRYSRVASEMQNVTVVGNDATINMFKTAEALGQTGSAAERVVRNAIGLGSVLGRNSESFIQLMTQLEQGETTMLQRYLPALRGIEDESERVATAQRMLAEMFAAAEGEAAAFSGQIAQAKNQLGDLLEEFGAIIADGLKPLVVEFRNVITWLQDLPPDVKSAVVATGALSLAFGTLVTGLGATILVAGQVASAYAALIQVTGALTTSKLALASASVAAQAGVAGLAVAGIAYLSYQIYQNMPSVKEFNAALEESAELANKVSQMRADAFRNIMDEAAGMSSAGEGKSFLEDELQRQKKELAGLANQIKMAESEAAKMEPTWLSLRQAGRSLWTEQLQTVQEAKDAYSQVSDQILAMEDEIRRLDQVVDDAQLGPDPEVVKAAEEYVEQLKLQRDTLGMTADQAKLYALQQQQINQETIDEAKALQDSIRAYEEKQAAQADLREESQQLLQGLSDQVMALEMEAAGVRNVSDEMRLMKLASQGASEEVIAAARALIDAKDAIAEHKEQQAAHNRTMDEGRRIAESLMTPYERYAKTVEDLNRLAGVGAINQTTLNRGIAQAADELASAEKAAEDAKKKAEEYFDTFVDNQLVRAGSEEFRRMLHDLSVEQRSSATRLLGASASQSLTESLPSPRVVEPAAMRPAGGEGDRTLHFLERIAVASETSAARPPIALQPAGLGGVG